MWTRTPLNCTVCSQIPVGNACAVISNGGTCEAETVDHECIEKGRLVFECPDMLSNISSGGSIGMFGQNLPLGDVWGSAHLSTRSLEHTIGKHSRPAQVRILSGKFGIKCRVCGLAAQVLEDRDVRAGRLDVLVEFGPNVLGGVVAERNIAGYGIYLVDGCSRRNSSMLAYVPKAEVASWPQGMEGFRVDSSCDCPRTSYRVRVTCQFPPSPARIMVVPVTAEGYALPVGVTSEILMDRSLATYAHVTGSFDLALSSPVAATSFAGDPAATAAVAFSLASIAGTTLESVSVHLFVDEVVANEAGNADDQGGRRLQRSTGFVRADFGVFFLEHDSAWSTGTANRYPQAIVFARQMQEGGASAWLARLVEQRLQAASGGVNKYGPLQIERMGPCKIEEASTANVTLSTVAPAMRVADEGPWWCRACSVDPTMQMAVASSGAVGMALSLSCALAVLLWCCKPCRRRHNDQQDCWKASSYHSSDASAKDEGSFVCDQCGYHERTPDASFAQAIEFRTPDASFAQAIEFHHYPGMSEGCYAI